MFEIIPFADRNFFKMFNELEKNFFDPSAAHDRAMGFRADVSDIGDSYLLEAEIPGYEKQDISVDVSNEVLTISATKNEEKKEDGKNYLYRERRFGGFKRCFDLSGIDTENIKCEYKNGVLELTLPKHKNEEPPVRKIEIN